MSRALAAGEDVKTVICGSNHHAPEVRGGGGAAGAAPKHKAGPPGDVWSGERPRPSGGAGASCVGGGWSLGCGAWCIVARQYQHLQS